MEAVTFSFLAPKEAALFGGGAAALTLVNPISADLSVMRPSALPNLLQAAGRNQDRGEADCALFEIGPVFLGDEPTDQRAACAGIRHGHTRRANGTTNAGLLMCLMQSPMLKWRLAF